MLSAVNHSLMVRPAGQMSVPFYRQETQHLSWDNKKKRAGNPFPAPTNVTGCPWRRVRSVWATLVSVIKHPELKGECLPLQMHVHQKQEKTKRTVFVHNDTPFQFYKNRFLSTFLSQPFISVRHLWPSQLYNLHISVCRCPQQEWKP